jgi:signal transduction histidine kinase
LRAPLTALKGHAQFLQRRLAKQPDRADDAVELNKILYQVARLENELDVYLDAARLFNRRFQLQCDRTDLVALARRLVALHRGGSADDVLTFETHLTEAVGQWDPRRMTLALGILLNNASKYGLGKEVDVQLRGGDDIVRVEVLDRGVGVPSKARRSIFSAYVTGDNVENAGLGLGLFVAREIIRRHGGTIGARARAGGGSIFWFELPTHADPATGGGVAERAGAHSNATPGRD